VVRSMPRFPCSRVVHKRVDNGSAHGDVEVAHPAPPTAAVGKQTNPIGIQANPRVPLRRMDSCRATLGGGRPDEPLFCTRSI